MIVYPMTKSVLPTGPAALGWSKCIFQMGLAVHGVAGQTYRESRCQSKGGYQLSIFTNLVSAWSISLLARRGSAGEPQRVRWGDAVGLKRVRSFLDPRHAFLLRFQL